MWAGLIVLVLALYTGYTLPAPTMIGALKWLTHLNVGLLALAYCIRFDTARSLSNTRSKH